MSYLLAVSILVWFTGTWVAATAENRSLTDLETEARLLARGGLSERSEFRTSQTGALLFLSKPVRCAFSVFFGSFHQGKELAVRAQKPAFERS